jgi:uncharacterized protein
MSSSRMLPYTKDRDTQGFFDAAREQRLVFRACKPCGKGLHPPTAYCPYCGSGDTHWREATGRGRLHSWTTVTHAIHPGYPVPYTVVLVQLDDSPEVRLVGRLDGAPPLEAGVPMQVWFEQLTDDVVLPQWRPL